MATDPLSSVYAAAGQSWNVDPALLQAIATTESGANPATPNSSAGAVGVMQLMPATAASLGVTNTSDPVQSIYGAAKYMSQLLDKYQSPELATAAYNAGPGRVDAYLSGQAALPTETLDYVPKVASLFKQYSAPQPAQAQGGTPAPYQLASASTGTQSDALPSPNAPPASDPFSQAVAAAAAHTAATGAAASPPSQMDPFSAAMATATKLAAQNAVAGSGGTPGAASKSPGFWNALFAGGVHGMEAPSDTLNAVADWLDRTVPGSAALDAATGLKPVPAAQMAADEAAYQAGPGKTWGGTIGNAAGNLLVTAPLLTTGLGAIDAGGGALAKMAGGTAGRIIDAGTNALTGAANGTPLARAAASIPTGSLFGAGNALLSAGQSSQLLSDQIEHGAEMGALLGPVAPAVIGAAGLVGKAGSKLGNAFLDAYAPLPAADATPAAAAPAATAPSTGNALLDQLFIEHQAEHEGRDYTAPALATGSAQTAQGPQAASAASQPAAAPAAVQPPSNALSSAGAGGPEVAATNPLAGAATSPLPSLTGADPAAAAPASNPLTAAQAIPKSLPPAGAIPPLTQSAAAARADAIIQHFAAGGNLDVDATPLIPGSAPTLAQSIVGGNAGLATLERTIQAQYPQAFDTVAQAAAAGRRGVLARLIGTPADIDAAEAIRDDATSAARNAAFANPQPVDAAPIMDQLQGLIKANNPRDTVQAPLQRVADQLNSIAPKADDGTRMADPDELYNLRKFVSDLISPRVQGGANDGRTAAAQLLQLKPTIDRTIEPGAPGFGSYIQQFDALSRPIDGMRYLQNLNLTDAMGDTTLQKLDTAVKGLARNQAKPGAQLADSVTPDQAGVLENLRDDMRRQALSGRGKGIGSDTTQKLATNALLSALGGTDSATTLAGAGGALGGMFLEPVTGALTLLGAGGRYALGAANQRAESMVRLALIDRLTNPALGARSLAPLRAAGQSAAGAAPSGLSMQP